MLSRWTYFYSTVVVGMAAIAACNSSDNDPSTDGPAVTPTGGSGGSSAGSGGSGGVAGSAGNAGNSGSGGNLFEGGIDGGGFDPDAACAQAQTAGKVEKKPVDIIWMVDNSESMRPAIEELTQGLNNFAALVSAKDDLDYRIIMLSLRADGETQMGGDTRFGVCIPQPLGGANCADGDRYFQSSIDMRSTQLLEQFLGTLGQTDCYRGTDNSCGNSNWGGPKWDQHLRPEASKTLVVVSDHDQRQTKDHDEIDSNPDHDPLGVWDFETFEDFEGGKNPHNWIVDPSFARALAPGILDSSWNGLFDGYVMHGLYGWNSESDPTAVCTYQGGGNPPAPGESYTHLIQKTGGVRAKICDGAAAWDQFFEDVASAVEERVEIECEIEIADALAEQNAEPNLVNVVLTGPSGQEGIYKVPGGAGDCGSEGGWYYDDESNPSELILCPTSCDLANSEIAAGEASVDILFGCESEVR